MRQRLQARLDASGNLGRGVLGRVVGVGAESPLGRARRMGRSLGPLVAVHYVLLRLGGRLVRRRLHRLRPRLARHPLWARAGTSDLDVFGQIFSGDEYASVSALEGVEVIIDGGANVGYSAAYFLSRYPRARVVSVEPDAENLTLARRNLEPYGARSILVHGALWSSSQELALAGGFRDARHWARQVKLVDDGTATRVRGYTVDELMALVGAERVSILKLDIEGAEAELFRTGYQRWIGSIDTIVVELHDDSSFGPAGERFRRATADRSPVYSRSGELTIARLTGPGPGPGRCRPAG